MYLFENDIVSHWYYKSHLITKSIQLVHQATMSREYVHVGTISPQSRILCYDILPNQVVFNLFSSPGIHSFIPIFKAIDRVYAY